MGAPVLPPVHFENRLAVSLFLYRRMAQHGLTHAALARHLDLPSPGAVAQLLTDPLPLSKTRHFPVLCKLLQLTPAESSAIRRAERRASREPGSRVTDEA